MCRNGFHNETQVIEWIKFFTQAKTWVEARNYCKDTVGGHLFFNVDGSWAQLEQYITKIGKFWLGIYTYDIVRPNAEWRSVNETIIERTRLYWIPNSGEPNNVKKKQFYVACLSKGLNDRGESDEYSFICDMVAD